MSYEIVKSEFPNATIFSSTFDKFVQALETLKPSLPIVTSEMGDTWIQGISSDPNKTAMYRAFVREFKNCLLIGIELLIVVRLKKKKKNFVCV